MTAAKMLMTDTFNAMRTQLADALAQAAASPAEGPRFTGSHNCMANLERDNQRRARQTWFGEKELRFFGTRFPRGFLDVEVARVTLFVTTESPPSAARAASVRAYLWDSAQVVTLGDFCAYSLKVADAAVELLWKDLKAQNA